MVRLRSYVQDQWFAGEGDTRPLVNPCTEEVVAETTTKGLDFTAALNHARSVGGPTLRAMTFAERGQLLKQMSRSLYAHREELIDLSMQNNGATRGDAKFDIDGATGTLAAYASFSKELGDRTFLVDGDSLQLAQGARWVGQHVRMPLQGAAIHINAFNFPAWGTFEKAAVSLLAGVPVITKPATATALTAYRMVEILVEDNVLPKGVLSFIAGSTGNLLDQLGPQDMVAFTGSAATGNMLRGNPNIVNRSVRFNVEADSLNAAVLGPDVGPGDDLWHCFVRSAVLELRQKTGQKCTATRRIIVPEARIDDLAEALEDELSRIVVGNTATDGITMGPVATAQQHKDVLAGIAALAQEADLICGGSDPVAGQGAPEGKGFYVAPTLLKAHAGASKVHELEVFGPSATLIAYDGSAEQAASLVSQGKGSLVTSAMTDDKGWLGTFLMGAAPWNGRVLTASSKVADQTTPAGMVLPTLVHGGPGRAGGGEELGGLRGLEAYTQRTAIQGDRGMLARVLGTK